MKKPRDSQRARLYRAERGRLGEPSVHAPPTMTMTEIRRWVGRLTRSSWWRRRFPGCRYIAVRDGRGRRSAAGQNCGHFGVIKLPRWARNPLVVLHEVAHAVQPRRTAAHGPEFARIYLDLVRRWIGPRTAVRLNTAMRRERVLLAPRHAAYRSRGQL